MVSLDLIEVVIGHAPEATDGESDWPTDDHALWHLTLVVTDPRASERDHPLHDLYGYTQGRTAHVPAELIHGYMQSPTWTAVQTALRCAGRNGASGVAHRPAWQADPTVTQKWEKALDRALGRPWWLRPDFEPDAP